MWTTQTLSVFVFARPEELTRYVAAIKELYLPFVKPVDLQRELGETLVINEDTDETTGFRADDPFDFMKVLNTAARELEAAWVAQEEERLLEGAPESTASKQKKGKRKVGQGRVKVATQKTGKEKQKKKVEAGEEATGEGEQVEGGEEEPEAARKRKRKGKKAVEADDDEGELKVGGGKARNNAWRKKWPGSSTLKRQYPVVVCKFA